MSREKKDGEKKDGEKKGGEKKDGEKKATSVFFRPTPTKGPPALSQEDEDMAYVDRIDVSFDSEHDSLHGHSIADPHASIAAAANETPNSKRVRPSNGYKELYRCALERNPDGLGYGPPSLLRSANEQVDTRHHIPPRNALSQASFTLASDTGLSAPLPMNPIRFARTFQSQGTLPNGFPEARDLTADVQSGKVQIRGQSRFSNVDQFSATPPLYLDTSPLPPTDLLRALSPPPQILLSGDGLQYPGFLRSFSVADMPGFDWAKLIGTVSFLMLSAFAPFQDDGPFLSHKTIVKQLVNVLRESKKQNKQTMFWLAYPSRTNVADSELATILDRRIDLIPSLPYLNLSVVCPVIHLAQRAAVTRLIEDLPTPNDNPLIIFQLTSKPLAKDHVPKVVEYYPRAQEPAVSVDGHTRPLFTPTSTNFQIRLDVPQDIVRDIDGTETRWHISGTLPLMLLINGLSPDDGSTVLRNITVPRITKNHWPVTVSSAPDGYKVFDFHVPMDIMARFYEEEEALADMGVSFALLHSSIKSCSIIVTHQPPFKPGAQRKKKMPANEIRDAIDMNPHLRKKFEFITFLNKYDAFCMVKDEILLQPAIQEIENLGDLLVISATTHQRLRAKDVVRTVQPPHVLVRFSPSFSVADVLHAVSVFGPVTSHQLFQQAGLLLVSFQAPQSATAAYGSTLPGPVFLTSGSLAADTALSLEERLQRLDLSSLPTAALNESNLAAVPNALPSFSLPDINVGLPPPSGALPVSPPLSISPPAAEQEEDDRMTGQSKRTIDDVSAMPPAEDDASPCTFPPH